ncbi:MlaD family protein [Oceaniglobus ichthyenteri]|uniref:MlaD family protein n=1 Tax=Oceaniglobus ichthyenteri TaxID=2136177 RepID=UPI000D33F30B|nr:MlaD family protein [Oceaniglobus ichthyenteri]
METRANFILIGAFTLAGILGALGFMIWLANVQLDRQYAQYAILFEDVSGLDGSGDVLFNGISVGKVIELRIHAPDPSQIYVKIEVDATTPVREDTVAQLNSSAVTGVSYIALSNQGAVSAPLTAPAGEVPIITSKPSTLQQLVDGAPNLVAEATRLLEQFTKIVGPENQENVSGILSNLNTASGGLEQALVDFSEITATVADATSQIADFTDRLGALSTAAETTLANVDTALGSAAGAFDAAEGAISSSTGAIDSAAAAFAQAETLMQKDVPVIVAQISETMTTLNTAIGDLSTRSGATLDGFTETAGLLNARLTELETTLTEAETAFAAVTEASDSFDALVDGDGALLVAEARVVLGDAGRAIATIESVIDTDVPAVVADIRTAVDSAARAVEQVAQDITGATAQLDPMATDARAALSAATQLFDRAQTTLVYLDGALVSANSTLATADTTFEAATDVLSTDLGPVLEDIRATSARIRSATDQVADDLPAITSDLDALIVRADDVVKQVQSTLAAAAPGIRTFTGSGLAELTGLSSEARGLVQSLTQLVRRIEQDPARFLLDDRVPEYRR